MRSDGCEHATKEHPCPKCGSTDRHCMVLRRFIWCRSVESALPGKKGGWLHPITNAELAPLPPKKPKVTDEELDRKWSPIAISAFNNGGKIALAEILGVKVFALGRLEVGHDGIGWTFPECSGNGLVVGITHRFADGTKKCIRGGRRGLTYGTWWDKYAGCILVVEGASDTAVGEMLCVPTIGRPSNTGGVSDLAVLLASLPERRIIVLGENDKRTPIQLATLTPTHDPACKCCLRCWPGKAGAMSVAQSLARKLHRPVEWKMPPRKHKDLRAWFLATPEDERDELAKNLRRGRW